MLSNAIFMNFLIPSVDKYFPPPLIEVNFCDDLVTAADLLSA